jgi:hypothetical protein
MTVKIDIYDGAPEIDLEVSAALSSIMADHIFRYLFPQK